MRHIILFISALFLPGHSLAQTCIMPEPRLEERQVLLDGLAGSPDFPAGQLAANKLWDFWMDAPDAKAQAMLNDGMARRIQLALAEAEAILDELVTYCPAYAEGWNQRAFVRYLRADYDGSLEDIEETLKREPAHFGALSGKALALTKLGKSGQAKLATLRAVEVHPWLNERSLLGDGEDI